jgi:hypothetical protein
MKRTHPGRPPLDDEDPSDQICLTLPSTAVVAYRKRARREDVSLQEIIRRDLREKQPAPRIKI